MLGHLPGAWIVMRLGRSRSHLATGPISAESMNFLRLFQVVQVPRHRVATRRTPT
ncbi:hypothetical protein BDN71DRAFT_1455160 [Pleurotus eryngii]|uniref:Uncharacterized protein n=1 Tax=Pleurotus eryngii TaxID=5323 RepID=A0A9P5ZPP6_PLEER|nr:hypothetical protein BDN71DRAFT_1455160 [Pleurotus eryngii]